MNREVIFRYSPRLIILLFLVLGSVLPVTAVMNGTVTQVSFDYSSEYYLDIPDQPAITGDYIAWVNVLENVPPMSASRYVVAYNLQTGEEYAVAPSEGSWQTVPSADGSIIVWMDDPDGWSFRIVAYDIGTRAYLDEVPVSWTDYYSDPANNVFPKVWGDTVVWQDFSGMDWNIMSYTIGSATGIASPLAADGAYDEKYPSLYGDYVVYENWSSASSDIYIYFLSNSTAARISTSAGDEISPAIYGSTVVWEETSALTGRQVIMQYDLLARTASQITPAGADFDQKNPEISGSFVVVEDYREDPAYPDIYLYDLGTSDEKWLTPGSAGSKKTPSIDEDRVVWDDYRREAACGITCHDIYLLTLGSAETCPSADFTISNPSGPAPLSAVFTDTSSGGTTGITFRVWNFSDGSPWSLNPASPVSNVYALDGTYPVSLYAGNTKCRNLSVDRCTHRVYVSQSPVADFDATPEDGLAPLDVTFSDTSCGGPTSWEWDFGDGSAIDTAQNPSHRFSASSTEYSITLTAANAQGSDTATKTIRTYMGAESTSVTPVSGILVMNRFGQEFLVFNGTELPGFAPAAPETYISIRPPASYLWENITFLSTDGIGLKTAPLNSTYSGNISRVYLKTNDTVVNTAGTPPPAGTGWGVNYQMNTTTYPDEGWMKVEIREGSSGTDWDTFETLVRNSQPSGTTLRDIAYTAAFTRSGIPDTGTGLLNMSVDQSWVQGTAASVAEGRTYTYILAYGYDRHGNKNGAILESRYRGSAGTLDYFEAEVPDEMNYLSTFVLSKLSGSGNPLQLITLTIASHAGSTSSPSGAPYIASGSSDSDSGSAGGTGSGSIAGSAEPALAAGEPPAPATGITGSVYTNAAGVVTQSTTLVSADDKAVVTLSEGIVARDAAGNPLESITLAPSSGMGMTETGSSVLTFEGIAYELGPDGATFSPSITLTFTIPLASRGKEYTIRSYDTKSGTWQDLPTTVDPVTGKATAEVTHFCCFGLFAKSTATPAPTRAGSVAPAATPSAFVTPAAAPPSTAISIFTSMMLWTWDLVVANIAVIAVAVVIGGALLLYHSGRSWRRLR